MPTATWSMPIAAQNGITRSCALSLVVVFALAPRAVGPGRASQCAVSYSIAPVGALPCDRSLASVSFWARKRCVSRAHLFSEPAEGGGRRDGRFLRLH